MLLPFPSSQLFQIHGSKFKLHPVCHLSQASVLCIAHCVFFLGVRKDALNCFFSPLVKLLVFGRIAGVICQIFIALPDMPLYGLYARLGHSCFQLRRYMLRIACTADYTVNAPAVVPPIAQKYIRFKRSRQSARDGLRLPEPPMPHSDSHYGDKSISPFALYWTV